MNLASIQNSFKKVIMYKVLLLILLFSLFSCKTNENLDKADSGIPSQCGETTIDIQNIKRSKFGICQELILPDFRNDSEFQTLEETILCIVSQENITTNKLDYLREFFSAIYYSLEHDSSYENIHCIESLISKTLFKINDRSFEELKFNFTQLNICLNTDHGYLHLGYNLSLDYIYRSLNEKELAEYNIEFTKFRDTEIKDELASLKCEELSKRHMFLRKFIL